MALPGAEKAAYPLVVGSRVASPVFVGREEELASVRSALARDDPRLGPFVLVSGEAGIGKSRLLAELTASVARDPPASRPVLVLASGCIPVAAGELPYAPVVELLERAALTHENHLAEEARALASELSGAPDDQRDGGTSIARTNPTRRLIRLHALLARLADDRDVIVIVDDVHWADRSTLDALSFLGHRLVGERVAVIVAFRGADDGQPLRSWLMETRRRAVRLELELGPLDDAAVARQVAAILGDGAPVALTRAVVERADGNPFVVEELIAHGHPDGLPSSLREITAGSLRALPPHAVRVVAAAAVVGREVDRELLDGLVAIDPGDLDVALRRATDGRFLMAAPETGRLRFRHALLREAILEDLLPYERRRLHRRVAEILAASPGAGQPAAAAQIAHHWAEAGEADAAFAACIVAAAAAEGAAAFAEAAAQLDRALALWDEVAPEARADVDRLAILVRAERAFHLAGHFERAHQLVLEAIELVEPADDDALLARLCLDAAGILIDDDDPGDAAFLERALELTDGSRTRQRAMALGVDAFYQACHYRCRRAIEEAEAVVDMGETIAGPVAMGSAFSGLDLAHGLLGRPTESDVAFAAAIACDGCSGDPAEGTEVHANHAYVLHVTGRDEEALDLIESSVARAQARGTEAIDIPWYRALAADVLWWQGRWGECEDALDQAAEWWLEGQAAWMVSLQWTHLAAWRGDAAGLTAALSRGETLGSRRSFPWSLAYLWLIRGEAARWQGHPAACIADLDAGLDVLEPTEELQLRAFLVAAAIGASADAAEAARARRKGGGAPDAARSRDLAAAMRDCRLVPGAPGPASSRAGLALAEAETSRLDGLVDPPAWQRAVEALDGLGYRPYAAYARFRLGEALLGAGDRAGASEALTAARAVVEPLGARPLAVLIDDLARRARLDLAVATEPADGAAVGKAAGADGGEEAADPWGLSEREREVLALVAQGWTNRRIGEALFISPKTASVHVTHILDKLGVSSRTEAALLAGRAGVLGPAPDDADA